MTEHIVVRVAGPDDAAAVETVLRASYPHLMALGYSADLLTRALPLMTRANPALLRSGTYYLAEAQVGAVVGCGGWTLERPGAMSAAIDPTLGHIRHFATHPDWIRCGIGRALLERCVADARRVGVQRFECCSSVVAEPFYGALGFVAVESIAVDMGSGIVFPSVRMIRHLTD
jgi:N-acetylglutamate synthase-like GNAT family acetyltransferase